MLGAWASDKHPKRPTLHASLGGEVLLASLFLVGGFYYLSYAYSQGATLTSRALLVYALLGILSVIVGIAFSVDFLASGI